jgi:Mg-chelatase subunit ChlD
MKNIFLFVLILILSCSKQPVKNTETTKITEILFDNVQPNHQIPNKIQYLFSLRDQDNHAVEILNRDLDKVEVNIKENEQNVDNNESNVLIHNSDNFRMDVVLVLDFSASMAENDGIPFMIDGAVSLINSLKSNHRIAIIEFHDNNESSNFSLIQSFTTDKEEAIGSLNNFIESGFYSGFSTCWDAVNLALEQFPTEINYQIIRAVVFLSDGNDNSSFTISDDLISNALEKNVRIYNIGIGNITNENQNILTAISEQTGGKFYQNNSITFLQNEFDQIISDLGGNYIISYITPQNSEFQVNISLTYKDITTTNPISETIEPNLIAGDDKLGILKFSAPIVHNDSISYYLEAVHIPRNVTQLKFAVESEFEYCVQNVDIGNGGLISDWSIPTKNDNGFWITKGSELSFGDFGKLCEITFLYSRLDGFSAKFIIDNSIYNYGVKFAGGDINDLDENNFWRTEIIYGFALFKPEPKDFAEEQDSLINLSWNVSDDSLNVRYAIFLDKNNPPLVMIADSLLENTYQTLVDTASTYFWQVKAFTETDEKYGNIWKFTTK